NYLVARNFATALVNYGQSAVTIHGDDLAATVFHGLKLNVLDSPIHARLVLRLLFQTSRAAYVERAHGKLRAGFAYGLRGDDADRFAYVNHPTRGEVATIAFDADAATRFAGQDRTNAYALNA